MASFFSNFKAGLVLVLFALFHILSDARKIGDSDETQNSVSFRYHNGPLLNGNVAVNLIWYGRFKPSQRAIVSDFLASLATSRTKPQVHPSVATWWKTVEKYYHVSKNQLVLSPGKQTLDVSYSLGKSLTDEDIKALAARGGQNYAVNVVLTSDDVAVTDFCMSRCGSHGSAAGSGHRSKFAYIWVGNSETQCPGQCAWPFHAPIYGPQNAPLVAPNNDVGIDGMVINLASLLAGTATNPFGNGYFQGPKTAPLEAASACTGIYGKGAYPGYAGNLLVDTETGASFNAYGANGRKFLLPALFDPETSACSPLV